MSKKIKNILIVEDEPFLQEIWVEQFEAFDVSIFIASNGDEAVEILKENTIDFILSDLTMPGSNGFVILNYLKFEYPSKPVVYICSGFVKDHENLLGEFEISKIIPKPFDLRTEMIGITQLLKA